MPRSEQLPGQNRRQVASAQPRGRFMSDGLRVHTVLGVQVHVGLERFRSWGFRPVWVFEPLEFGGGGGCRALEPFVEELDTLGSHLMIPVQQVVKALCLGGCHHAKWQEDSS